MLEALEDTAPGAPARVMRFVREVLPTLDKDTVPTVVVQSAGELLYLPNHEVRSLVERVGRGEVSTRMSTRRVRAIPPSDSRANHTRRRCHS